MLHLEMEGRDVISFKGRVTLLAAEAEIAAKLLAGDRVCNAEFIPGYAAMSSAERTNSRCALGSRVAKLRLRLRTIGVDVVTIYGWGLQLEPLASPDAHRSSRISRLLRNAARWLRSKLRLCACGMFRFRTSTASGSGS